MSKALPIVRRKFLRLLAAGTSVLALPVRFAAAQSLDQGIGGTGSVSVIEEEDEKLNDRGIGGTGVIGTIRRFGSIIVNGLRISYPPNATVRIDGVPANTADLKIGQVVRVVAVQRHGLLSTQAIDVVSEVVGDIESISTDHIIVLGQTVSITGLDQRQRWYPGDRVAVSGLRRPDGTIVASRIDRRNDSMARVAGPVVRAPDGSLRIGDLKLSCIL